MTTLRSVGCLLLASSVAATLGPTGVQLGGVPAADHHIPSAAASTPPSFLSSSAADPCATPLPLDHPVRGIPRRRVTVLRGGPNRFELIQARNSRLGFFTFASGLTAYVGLAHVFEHGVVRHVCVTGPVAMERAQGGYAYGGPLRIVPVRLDGVFNGSIGNVTLTVSRVIYNVYGTTTTR